MSFGSLQTVFMARNGIDEYDIGIAQGAASIIGFIGVSIFPYLKRQISLSTTAICSIWYFSFTCGIGMLFLMLYTPPNVWGFTYAIISSRYILASIYLCPFNLCKHELKCVYYIFLNTSGADCGFLIYAQGKLFRKMSRRFTAIVPMVIGIVWCPCLTWQVLFSHC